MKKTNLRILVLFIILIFVCTGLIACRKNENSGSENSGSESEISESVAVNNPEVNDKDKSETSAPETKPAKKPKKESEVSNDKVAADVENIPDSPTISMSDALFIGDSRTVGLWDYAGVEDADYFADVGMSVYNIDDVVVSVPSIGRVNLSELLEQKNYGKIYLMLGINEAGYDVQQTAENYEELVEELHKAQPNAEIFLQANLHVSEQRSKSDTVINNSAIDKINQEISKIANGKNIFYLDANELFDDENGNLAADKTGDDTHLFAKYYEQWSKWIIWQTAVIKEEHTL